MLLSDYGDVRLSGATTSGKLEIGMTSSQWTTVCHDGFSDAAATVVCRQLGYDHASYFSMYVHYCLFTIHTYVCTLV